MSETAEKPATEAVDLDRLVRCKFCEGLGTISYNPNLNPNSFPASTFHPCRHCDGTGIDDSAND